MEGKKRVREKEEETGANVERYGKNPYLNHPEFSSDRRDPFTPQKVKALSSLLSPSSFFLSFSSSFSLSSHCFQWGLSNVHLH